MQSDCDGDFTIDPNEIDILVLRLKNAQGVELEEEKFKQILLTFLQKFTEDSMVIDELEIWHQKPVLETDLIKAKDKSKGISTNRSNNRRNEELTQVYSLEVTVIMSISYFFLPSNLLGSMAAETIDGNQDLLLGLLRGQNSFYGYFKQMDNIDTIAIDIVTNPPTVSHSSPSPGRGHYRHRRI